MVTPKIRLRPNPGGESAAVTGGVPVGDGAVKDGEGVRVAVGRLGVWVAVGVAGGVTSRSNF